jgi:hypothetical protein
MSSQQCHYALGLPSIGAQGRVTVLSGGNLMSINQNKIIHTKITFHRMSRRAFLRLAAHLSLLYTGLAIQRTIAAGAVQATPQAGGYGNDVYGQGIYPGLTSFWGSPGASLETFNHTIYLPIVSKEES